MNAKIRTKILKLLSLIVIIFSFSYSITPIQPVIAATQKVSKKQKNKIKRYTFKVTNTKITNFNQKVLNKYHLLGESYFRTNLTYNVSALPENEQKFVDDTIAQLNKFGIVNLREASKADITFSDENNSSSSVFGKDIQYYYSNTPEANGLKRLLDSKIEINNDGIQSAVKSNNFGQKQYRQLYKRTVAHELGHALGLAHSSKDGSEEMAACKFVDLPDTYTNPLYDQSYCNSLAALY